MHNLDVPCLLIQQFIAASMQIAEVLMSSMFVKSTGCVVSLGNLEAEMPNKLPPTETGSPECNCNEFVVLRNPLLQASTVSARERRNSLSSRGWCRCCPFQCPTLQKQSTYSTPAQYFVHLSIRQCALKNLILCTGKPTSTIRIFMHHHKVTKPSLLVKVFRHFLLVDSLYR